MSVAVPWSQSAPRALSIASWRRAFLSQRKMADAKIVSRGWLRHRNQEHEHKQQNIDAGDMTFARLLQGEGWVSLARNKLLQHGIFDLTWSH